MEPQLHDIDATLRAEMRLEAEEAEREAARSVAMRRTLRDVATELMAHGDTVRIGIRGAETLEGQLCHVGTDYLSLEARARRFDIRLDGLSHLEVAVRALRGGRGASPDQAPGWRARLLELELEGTTVEFRTVEGDGCSGKVSLVGADHFCVTSSDGRERFLPFPAVAFLQVSGAAPSVPAGTED